MANNLGPCRGKTCGRIDVLQQSELHNEVDQKAAEWLARIDRGNLNAFDQIALNEWLDADPRHRGALARLEAMFVLVDRAKDAETLPKLSPATIARRLSVSRREALWFGGGVVAMAGAAKVASIATQRFETYQTARGEIRAVSLDDGTIVTLNTASKIDVRFAASGRDVRLLEGEAIFDVAKDPSRPFTVAASNTVVRAVGTSFLVRDLDGRPTEILVAEGIVDVFRGQTGSAPGLRMGANSHAVALDVPYPSVKLVGVNLNPVAVARQLAWRTGMISFEDESLGKAIEKFQRYSDLKIIVDDPEVAEQTVTGLFSIHDPQGFAHSVALSLDLKLAVTPTGIMLWR
jgi:transmembrane sensor